MTTWLTRAASLSAASALVVSLTGAVEAADVNRAPTRVISGALTGLNTPNGLALDAAGNLYVANAAPPNGPPNQVAVFSATAHGNTAPSRVIAGGLTELDGVISVAVDRSGAIFVASNSSDSIQVFAPGAHGNVAPARVIQGAQTGLSSPLGISLDPQGRLYVANGSNSVTVYGPTATGNAAPVRTITGAATGLNDPQDLALGADGSIFVANLNGSVTAYPAGANGNAAPVRTISGPATTLVDPGAVAVDSGGFIYVGGFGTQQVAVFNPGANGNVAPRTRLVGPATQLQSTIGDVAVDPLHRVTVSDVLVSTLLSYAPLVPIVKPGKVRNLRVSGRPAAAKRTISWQPPLSTGNAPISSYQIVVKKGSKVLVRKVVPGSRHSLVVRKSRLRNGLNTAIVRAKNPAGFGGSASRSFGVVK